MCIRDRGKALKKPKKEIEIFAKRAMNYKNLYDPEHKLMRGKNEDGDVYKRQFRSGLGRIQSDGILSPCSKNLVF